MVSGERCGYNIIEKDCNGDVLCTWTYPSSTNQQRELALRKCRFEGPDTIFLYGRCGTLWYYIFTNESPDIAKLPKVRQFAICVWSSEFNPEMYEALSKVMANKYNRTGNNVLVLELYLAATTIGEIQDSDFSFSSKDFPQSMISQGSTNIKEIISNFGLETILIYTAVLLKKRIIVYHHDMATLLKTVRSLPALVSHRGLYSNIFPCVDLQKDEIFSLKSCANFVAGCRDANVASSDLFDVFVHLPATEISIAPSARESMSMTRAHKEIAFYLVQLSQNENLSERQVVTAISTKTNDLLEQLRTLATTKTSDGKSMVTLDSLRAKNLPHGMENFLFNLAIAEDIMMV
ncbi:DENN domain-containing protein 10-like [Neocloeon triangulifer]|uniref:DENN domain-containing protein 10-like n=1 Tax=Neocloeon triangulifer TaxID=2078957 RepID=UPI00286F180D|nr:DENN domain-containing protein 10-like [Neocloeon triangulifer]